MFKQSIKHEAVLLVPTMEHCVPDGPCCVCILCTHTHKEAPVWQPRWHDTHYFTSWQVVVTHREKAQKQKKKKKKPASLQACVNPGFLKETHNTLCCETLSVKHMWEFTRTLGIELEILHRALRSSKKDVLKHRWPPKKTTSACEGNIVQHLCQVNIEILWSWLTASPLDLCHHSSG